MPYKITSLERLIPPQAMATGWARWRAIVDFWDDDPKTKITEEVILDRSTQTMRNLGDDNWELVSKEDTLVETLTDLLDEHEPKYVQRVRGGEKGNKGSISGKIHGTKIDSDDILKNEKVAAMISSEVLKDDAIKP